MKKMLWLLLFFLAFSAGCGKEGSRKETEYQSEEEILNAASWQIEEVSVGDYGLKPDTGSADAEEGEWKCRGLKRLEDSIYVLLEKRKKGRLLCLDEEGFLTGIVSFRKEAGASAEDFFINGDGNFSVLSGMAKGNDLSAMDMYYDCFLADGTRQSHLEIKEFSGTANEWKASKDGFLVYGSAERKLTFYGTNGERTWETELKEGLWYDCASFDPSGDIYILTFEEQSGEKYLLKLRPETGETKAEYPLDLEISSGSPSLFFGTGEKELYVCSGEDGIYQCDIETGDCRQLIDWTGSGIEGEKAGSVCPFGEGFLCVPNTYSSAKNGLYHLSMGEKEERQVLTLGICDPNRHISGAVAAFNKGQDQVQVKIKNYALSGGTDMAEKLQMDIASGNCPDILDQSIMDMESLINKGAFVDLYSFMGEDKEMYPELFLDNVRKLLEKDRKLYFLPQTFMIKMLVCDRKILGEGAAVPHIPEKGIPIETLSGLLEKYPEKSITGHSSATGSQAGFLISVLNSGKIEAYFASDESEEKLKQLLEFCKKLPESCYEMFPTYTSDLEAIKSGNFLFIEADGKGLFNKSLFQFLRKGYGKNNYVLTGYPSVEGSGIYLYVDREWPKLGISASCENKEAAWKFIRSLLTEEAQEDASYLPIRKEAFEKMLESREDYVMENGKKRYLTKKERALVYRLVDSAGYIMISGTSNEGELTTIVAEEAESYFSGDKDLDETMKVIKSRINLYKNERE